VKESQNRKANRVFFQAPARLCAAYGIFDATIEDISWSGIRLRMNRSDLNLKPGAGIGAAAACVQHLLGSDFAASLDSTQATGGVLKRLQLVRLSLPDREDHAVDLGCIFEDRLTDREAHVLGLALPPSVPRGGQVRREIQFQDRDTRRMDLHAEKGPANTESLFDPEHRDQVFVPRKPFRAVLARPGGGGLEPLVCATESFTPNTVLVRARGEMISFGRPPGRRDAAGAAMQFTERYGERIDLELVDGTSRAWQGRTHVCSVELDPNRPRDILLRLAFGRPLQEAELKRLRNRSAATPSGS
jgi:hypothetical protein